MQIIEIDLAAVRRSSDELVAQFQRRADSVACTLELANALSKGIEEDVGHFVTLLNNIIVTAGYDLDEVADRLAWMTEMYRESDELDAMVEAAE